jgi:hypothetical protein
MGALNFQPQLHQLHSNGKYNKIYDKKIILTDPYDNQSATGAAGGDDHRSDNNSTNYRPTREVGPTNIKINGINGN